MPKPIHVLNGPNLNMLGPREPSTYGADTFADACRRAQGRSQAFDLRVQIRQPNQERELVNWIEKARDQNAGILLNAGHCTHASHDSMDTSNADELSAFERDLSNVERRRACWHRSYISLVTRCEQRIGRIRSEEP
jgi:3-dehydroquinate dehydratase-2